MDAVAEAFDAVPRSGFLRARTLGSADQDRPLDIGHGQTNSQPRTVATMLRLLQVEPGNRVLDIGAGSGWTTALLGHLVGPTGEVVGIELVPELAAWGEENLRRTAYSWASIREPEPGLIGAPSLAPFDRILVSADPGRMPPGLTEQLGDPGRMVLPIASRMTLLIRTEGTDEFQVRGAYRFVPLIEP